MKNTIAVILIFLLVTGIGIADEGKKYGEKITVKETTQIGTILDAPDTYVGKTVLIEGTVVNVCDDAGCWIDVKGSDGNTIRVKVDDGVIVFPVEEKGKTAKVQGVVYGVEVEEGADMTHVGEEQKEEKKSCLDECSTPCGEKKEKKTKTVYMLKGIGAVIG